MVFAAMSLGFPNRPLGANSHTYIKRPPCEERACWQIDQPGGFLRIQASQKMGKTSLVNQVLFYGQTKGYQTVSLDLRQAESDIFSNLDKFLRWFCLNVGYKLKLPSKIKSYWDEDIGSKVNCTFYFEEYLLAKQTCPVVLAIAEVNRLFDYPEIAQEFLPMLRYWYEQAQQTETFEKLRLILVHSTEIYIKLPVTQSPFNIGLPLKLAEFTLGQIEELAKIYGLDWEDTTKTQQLMDMIGGHPYLVNLALYHLSQKQITLEELLAKAPTQSGIYSDYLRHIWHQLTEYPELLKSCEDILNAKEQIQLEPILAYKLESLGIIKTSDNQSTIKAKLYSLYFKNQNLIKQNQSGELVKELKQENQKLKTLVNVDDLTNLANRRYFNQYLEQQWLEMVSQKTPISLIIIDIDCFKAYNDTYGHQQGDLCLAKVARAIASTASRSQNLVARYGGEEFAVILPFTNGKTALSLAKKINEAILNLKLEHPNSSVLVKKVTGSLGVASIIPKHTDNINMLIRAADEALYESKKQGKNRATLSPFLNFHLALVKKED